MSHKLRLPTTIADEIRKKWNLANGEMFAGKAALGFFFQITEMTEEKKIDVALKVGSILGKRNGPNINSAANFIETFEEQILNTG